MGLETQIYIACAAGLLIGGVGGLCGAEAIMSNYAPALMKYPVIHYALDTAAIYVGGIAGVVVEVPVLIGVTRLSDMIENMKYRMPRMK